MPRAFVLGVPDELPDHILLPEEDYSKFHKVLRLKSGDEVAILPNDGRLVRAKLEGRGVVPISVHRPETEPAIHLTLALALSKPDSLENSVRMGSEMGVSRFVMFPSDRSVVRWDEKKRESRLRRLRAIAREAAEVSFRTKLPTLALGESLSSVLADHPHAQVLSEMEGIERALSVAKEMTLVIGPEGGWSPRESQSVADRAVTLGPRVLRVDTAVASACSLALFAR